MNDDIEAGACEGSGIVTGRRGNGYLCLGAAVEVLVARPGLYLLAGDKLRHIFLWMITD